MLGFMYIYIGLEELKKEKSDKIKMSNFWFILAVYLIVTGILILISGIKSVFGYFIFGIITILGIHSIFYGYGLRKKERQND